MRKLKLIYNPFSGNKSFKFELDVCTGIFQEGGFEVHLFRTMKQGDITTHIEKMADDYDLIVVAGGDGTVNIVVNAMMKRGLDMPLGIIPAGTANDFATFLGFKTGEVETCCRAMMERTPIAIDLGLVNDETYFINVCAGGLLTNVSQTVDKDVKNALGSLSYYLKGVEQLPAFHKMPFRITTSDQVIEDKFYLYMIMNSAGTGGFSKLSPQASIQDGKFELLAIRAKNLLELPSIFLKMLTGDHVKDKSVLYLKDNYFKIEYLGEKPLDSTVDGEMGPTMPFEIRVVPKAIRGFNNFPK